MPGKACVGFHRRLPTQSGHRAMLWDRTRRDRRAALPRRLAIVALQRSGREFGGIRLFQRAPVCVGRPAGAFRNARKKSVCGPCGQRKLRVLATKRDQPTDAAALAASRGSCRFRSSLRISRSAALIGNAKNPPRRLSPPKPGRWRKPHGCAPKYWCICSIRPSCDEDPVLAFLRIRRELAATCRLGVAEPLSAPGRRFRAARKRKAPPRTLRGGGPSGFPAETAGRRQYPA